MNIQYAKFTSLVLRGINGDIPIFPFDAAYGKDGNYGYHYSPDVDLIVFEGELGFAIGEFRLPSTILQCTSAVFLFEER